MAYKCEVHLLPALASIDPVTGQVVLTCDGCKRDHSERIRAAFTDPR